ncbi:MAG: N-acetylmuramoyl-L-alanine amidase [Clostridiales bacterium]|nr:N-acetylmuramoyl-L-alanine amidase [Clostridiales bacterium]
MNMSKDLIVADNMVYSSYKKAGAATLSLSLDVAENTADIRLSDVEAIKKKIETEVLQKLGNEFLVISKPKGESVGLTLENIYIDKTIKIYITGMADNNISSNMILRIRGDELFAGEPQYTEIVSLELDEDDQTLKELVRKDYGRDLSHGIAIKTFEDTDSKLYTAQLDITLSSVYECFVYEDEDNYYIDLKKPSELYDKIVVIDAGHGGKDGGAVSRNNRYCEKDLNLDILLRLKDLLEKTDIKAYYTRTTDQTVYLRPRVELVNAVDADYFISIHINANKKSSPNGMEVLYYDNEFKGVKSKDLAILFSKELEKTVTLRQKGIVNRTPEDLYILDHSLVPTVLLELGYISNEKDLDYLTREENRQRIANAIFNGILRAYNELPVTD